MSHPLGATEGKWGLGWDVVPGVDGDAARLDGLREMERRPPVAAGREAEDALTGRAWHSHLIQ